MKQSTAAIAIAILLIATLGAFLRFYQLDSLVPILNRDEAALGYNALLLTQAGVDEWGESWSFTLRSFGDYKLIGYPSLLISLFKIFQADDFWVRLPSALAGVGIILISYPLARVFKLSKIASLLFMLVIGLAPFAIFYSRFAYEANVALFYVLLAIWILLGSWTKLRPRWLFDMLAITLLTLACFTYNSPLILFVPIVIIVAISRIKDGRKSWLPLLVMGMIAWIGVVWAIYPVITQKSGISLMTDPLVASQYPNYRQNLPNLLKPLIGNQYIYWVQLATENAFKSISPEFLLTKIFHPWHGIPGRGQLLWPVAVMGWMGLVWLGVRVLADLLMLIRQKTKLLSFEIPDRFRYDDRVVQDDGYKQRFILLSLTFVSLIPAIITVDAPHATRSLLFLYLLCLISVWGVEQLILAANSFVHQEQIQKLIHYLLPTVMAILVVVSASMYIQDLFGRYRLESKSIFQAGLANIIEKLPEDGRVAVLDPEGYDYIRWAWYSKLSTEAFLSSIVRHPPSVAGLRYGEQAGRFHMIDQVGNREASDINLVQWNEAKASWEVLP